MSSATTDPFCKWSELIKNEVKIGPKMELVKFEKTKTSRFPPCECKQSENKTKDEL